MARKLYVFNVTAKPRAGGGPAPKRGGTFSNSYSYLGDFNARLLGINAHTAASRMPRWIHNAPAGVRAGRGAASRLDEKFRGWGL